MRIGTGFLTSNQSFGDYFLHIEWWTPDNNGQAQEQLDGNSGVFNQGRYEVQVLNSYGKPLSGFKKIMGIGIVFQGKEIYVDHIQLSL